MQFVAGVPPIVFRVLNRCRLWGGAKLERSREVLFDRGKQFKNIAGRKVGAGVPFHKVPSEGRRAGGQTGQAGRVPSDLKKHRSSSTVYQILFHHGRRVSAVGAFHRSHQTMDVAS